MCELEQTDAQRSSGKNTLIPVREAVGAVLAHDLTEIRPGAFKGVAFRKGHIVRSEDIPRLLRLGKEHLAVLAIGEHEVHEDDAARTLAEAFRGGGVGIGGEPREGKINLVALWDGMVRVDTAALLGVNMLGELMCATTHDGTVVRAGTTVAATRAIPLVVERAVVNRAVDIAGKRRDQGLGRGSAPTPRPGRRGDHG